MPHVVPRRVRLHLVPVGEVVLRVPSMVRLQQAMAWIVTTNHRQVLPRRELLPHADIALVVLLLGTHREERVGEHVQTLIRLSVEVPMLERAERRLHVHGRDNGEVVVDGPEGARPLLLALKVVPVEVLGERVVRRESLQQVLQLQHAALEVFYLARLAHLHETHHWHSAEHAYLRDQLEDVSTEVLAVDDGARHPQIGARLPVPADRLPKTAQTVPLAVDLVLRLRRPVPAEHMDPSIKFLGFKKSLGNLNKPRIE